MTMDFSKHYQTLASIESSKRLAQKNLEAALARIEIPCPSCSYNNMIGDHVLYDEQYYVEPYGCTGGDYWTHAEYFIICEGCDKRIRFLFDSQYKVKWEHRSKWDGDPENLVFKAARPLFESVKVFYPKSLENKEVYSKDFVNSQFFDENMKSFVHPETYDRFVSYFDEQYLKPVRREPK